MVLKAKYPHKSIAFDDFDPSHKYEMSDVISNYDEVFQEPKGLPPKREIQHEIHLHQDVSLPNIGMYKMYVLKNEDIKKLVQDLLERGVIQ